MSLTQTLIHFAATLRIEDIPAPTQHKLKLHLIDAIGCGWAASNSQIAGSARAAAMLLGGQGPCHVFGPGMPGHTGPAAAFANALIINGLDHDDGVEIDGKGLGHPGSSLIAAAMAAMDLVPCGISGDTLLIALAAGLEINNRLIHAVQPSAERFAQVYGIAQHQAVGAAIVAGRILGLDAPHLHHACGLAATLSCVPSLHKYNWSQRPLVSLKDGVAPAAQAGVQAALLARLDFVGSLDVLDGDQGYWRMLGSDRFAADILENGLGHHWHADYGSIKLYPACRWLACALECMDILVEATGWWADDISRIEVRTFRRAAEDFMDRTPANPTDAQFSLPYTLAALALRLPPGPAWYSQETFHSPELYALMARIEACTDDDFEARMQGSGRQPGAAVRLVHRDGRHATETRHVPIGSAARPLDDTAILEKALRNTQAHLPQPQAWMNTILDNRRWHDHWHDSRSLVGLAAV